MSTTARIPVPVLLNTSNSAIWVLTTEFHATRILTDTVLLQHDALRTSIIYNCTGIRGQGEVDGQTFKDVCYRFISLHLSKDAEGIRKTECLAFDRADTAGKGGNKVW